MITFYFENGCIATLRGSGTEPKLKYYVEMSGTDRAAVALVLDKLVPALIEECLRPAANGLQWPSE
jgi:phosphomannomutase